MKYSPACPYPGSKFKLEFSSKNIHSGLSNLLPSESNNEIITSKSSLSGSKISKLNTLTSPSCMLNSKSPITGLSLTALTITLNEFVADLPFPLAVTVTSAVPFAFSVNDNVKILPLILDESKAELVD